MDISNNTGYIFLLKCVTRIILFHIDIFYTLYIIFINILVYFNNFIETIIMNFTVFLYKIRE
jgi:hypothetical protein